MIGIPLDKPSKCPKILTDEINLNKKVIEQYPLEAATPYSKGLGLDPLADHARNRREVPVVVTASSHTHFSESLTMVHYVREVLFKKHGITQIVYFDIGLTFLQRIRMQRACQCDFRVFPFQAFPDHVRTIYGFAWKPIAIQLALQDYGSIMWMDSSVRFVRSLEQVFKSAYKHGIQVTLSFAPNTTVSNTDLQTFKTLGEEPCSFRNTMETYATWMILHSTPFIAEYVMKPWVSCALIPNCMVVDRVPWSCDIDKSTYGACHRFDQSVLSIILNRLYFKKLESIFHEADVWKKCGAADSKWYFPDIVNNYIYSSTSLCI
ncbi:hypothetical protein ACJMK2_020135 [Sinanodonta woodiana]|uniref:Uncharacterized protein n=1 Tax=Sinanodonta woodiana TaxID=1069815 RepID=A0ABD3TZ56_SINWO